MKLSQGEKLILLTLAAKEDGKEKLNLAFIRSAILSGNTWALSWEFSGIPFVDTDEQVAKETADILSMWSYIEHCIQKLTPDEQQKLKNDAYPYDLAFKGFDANNDEHYKVASFLIKEMNRFDEFKGRDLNSHSQFNLPYYQEMLQIYDIELEAKGFTSEVLSTGSILKILKLNK